jgi:hypothetical protein
MKNWMGEVVPPGAMSDPDTWPEIGLSTGSMSGIFVRVCPRCKALVTEAEAHSLAHEDQDKRGTNADLVGRDKECHD